MIKAIKITQEVKDKNPNSASIQSSELDIIIRMSVPNMFFGTENVLGGYPLREDLHELDGFKEIVSPSYNISTHKLGTELIDSVDNTSFTYSVISKSQEEIQSELISISEGNKSDKVQKAQEAMALTELMNETDIPTILGNMDVYPIWSGDSVEVKNSTDNPSGIPDRFKHFNASNELTLYEVIQSHTTQLDWEPKDTPAMFKVVVPEGVIPLFVQPTGGHDAYELGDQVHYPTASDPIYESLINANTYSPTAYPDGWKLIQ